MNEGKKFEEDFIKSLPDDCFVLRLKDGGGWSDSEATRFTPQNDCDYVVNYYGKTWTLELKSTKGKSIPLSRLKQVDRMKGHRGYYRVYPAFIFNFRDVEKTYYIPLDYLIQFMETTERKSVPIDWCREQGIPVPQKLRRTRYRYNWLPGGKYYAN